MYSTERDIHVCTFEGARYPHLYIIFAEIRGAYSGLHVYDI